MGSKGTSLNSFLSSYLQNIHHALPTFRRKVINIAVTVQKYLLQILADMEASSSQIWYTLSASVQAGILQLVRSLCCNICLFHFPNGPQGNVAMKLEIGPKRSHSKSRLESIVPRQRCRSYECVLASLCSSCFVFSWSKFETLREICDRCLLRSPSLLFLCLVCCNALRYE